MAINPSTRYPGKIIAPNTPYPYGSARNITTPGDGTGTPWEANLINDMWGMLQGMLQQAQITPSGNPDTATSSQYIEALRAVSSSAVKTISANTTLTAKDAGVIFMVGQPAAVISATLPTAASAPGARFTFVATNTTGEGPQVIRGGTDRIRSRNAFDATNGDTSFYVGINEVRTIVSDGVNRWFEETGPVATVNNAGGLKLASEAEAQAMANSTKAITPYTWAEGFKGAQFWGRSGFNGYLRFPNGIIVQWGQAPGNGTQFSAALPIAWPNSILSATATISGILTGQGIVSIEPDPNNGIKTHLRIGSSVSTVAPRWIAIGY